LPSQRKAALAAKEALKHFKINKIETDDEKSKKRSEGNDEDVPLHAWRYSDWIKLNEEIDETLQLPRVPQPSSRINPPPVIPDIDLPLPSTPDLESMITFNIEQFNAQASFGLLQMFPPVDEPEPEWDHSPQFLTGDAHVTWDETMDVDDKVTKALEPRKLFQASDTETFDTESLTSSASDDSTFFDESKQDETQILQRSVMARRGIRRDKRIEGPKDGIGRAVESADEPIAADNLDVTDSEDNNLDAIHTAAPAVNNLVDLEIELETNDVAEIESNPSNDEGQEDVRPRRASRREIDYKYLNTFGHGE
jgi:hypothetical protein